MAKRKRPQSFPPFVVNKKTNEFVERTQIIGMPMNYRIMNVEYGSYVFSKNLDLGTQLASTPLRLPTYAEILLYGKD